MEGGKIERDITVLSCDRDTDMKFKMGENPTTLSGEFTFGKELQVG
jgi:hypothetical protein